MNTINKSTLDKDWYEIHATYFQSRGNIGGWGGNACMASPGFWQIKGRLCSQHYYSPPSFICTFLRLFTMDIYYLLKQIQLGFCWCGLRITTYAQIHQLAHFLRVNFPTNQFRGFRWSVMGNHSWNLIIVGSASQHIEVRGHSATTWTELCHFLPPPHLGVDSFYTLSVNKNRHFLTPFPLILST